MDPWVCTACEHAVHDRCFGSVVCECSCQTPEQPWVTADRRTELRQLAYDGLPTLHLPHHEQAYIDGLRSHHVQRQEAEARRA